MIRSALVLSIYLLSAWPVHAQRIGICERILSVLGQSQTSSLYSPAQKVQQQLGYLPVIVDGSNAAQGMVFIQAMHPELPVELARLTAELHDDDTTLAIDNIDVANENNRRKGLSELLLGQALARFPTIRRIKSTMALDNRAALKQALHSGMDCTAAMRNTPAYKMRARFGFTKFVKPPICMEDKSIFYFEVERPN